MKQLKLWDNENKQWLNVMSIFFNKEGNPEKITACKEGDNPLSDGWYDIKEDDLKNVAIKGCISFNEELIPKKK